VIYQIVTDRFANGDPSNDDADGVAIVPGDLRRVQGGDYRGILDQLDYIEHLGANTIWISPIVANVPRLEVGDGYHGYWARDFTTLNPRFGTLEDLQTLIATAHQRDIAVIIDVVPNHTGRVFDYDLDGDGVGDADPATLPRYRNTPYEPVVFSFTPRLFTDADTEATIELAPSHFHRRGIGDLSIPEERRYGDFPEGLRDLDTENREIEAALIETWVHWATLLDLDGFRIDAVPHVDRAFWPRFCTALRRRLAAQGKTNFYLMGEVFETDVERLLPWLEEGSIDATFDFPLKFEVIDSVILAGGPPSGALAALETNRARFRSTPQPDGIGLDPWQARVAFGDSHDVTRLRAALDDPFAVDQALTLLFTVDAIPLVYYGTEQDLAGGGGHLGREPLWEVGYDETAPTFQLIRLLAALRRESLALRRGRLVVRFLSEVGGAELDTVVPDAGLIVYERIFDDAHALIALNTHPSHTSEATVETALASGTVIDRIGGASFVVEEGRVTLRVPPRSSVILLP
jgi:glycosidase